MCCTPLLSAHTLCSSTAHPPRLPCPCSAPQPARACGSSRVRTPNRMSLPTMLALALARSPPLPACLPATDDMCWNLSEYCAWRVPALHTTLCARRGAAPSIHAHHPAHVLCVGRGVAGWRARDMWARQGSMSACARSVYQGSVHACCGPGPRPAPCA